MDKQSPVLEVKNISKKYSLSGSNEPFWALKDISFELRQGEILGVVGKNGAGKSTLLKILSDVIAPSSGSVKFNGVVVSILDIGTGFHPDLSGYDNIFLNASLFGMSKKEVNEKINEIIQFSGIEGFIHEPVRNYSNGMYLRLAFSIAVHINTQILLLDEVVAVGDNEFKEKCMSRLRFMADSGLTIVLVSHNMSQVLELCTRAIWIDSGVLQLDASPIDVIESYIEGFSAKINDSENSEFTFLQKELEVNIDDFAILKSVSISSGLMESPWPLYTGQPIVIKINCLKIKPEEALEVGIYLTNLDGLRIFLDSFALRPEYNFNQINDVGLYEIECTIPAFLLTRGVYHISLVLARSFDLLYHQENVLSFKVLSSTSETGKDGNFNNMNTIIAPRLHWTINKNG